ncbi:MAG: mechanosensitive ion channel [Methylotenera sp.]|nr:mechanosensitive ion channel [Methylotenera sp.]
MNEAMQLVWQEILADISTKTGLLQLAIVVTSLCLAWLVNGGVRTYVMRHAPEKLRLGIGGVNRVLFPLSALIFVFMSEQILKHWQHTSLLHLAGRLLLSLAIIRLIVYVVRYIIEPGGLLKTLESSISSLIWVITALHLSGLLPRVISWIESVEFSLGKTPVNLWLVLQGLLTVILTIIAAMWLGRLLEHKLMQAEHVDTSTRVVLTKVLRIILLFIAVLIGLSAVGLDLTLLSVFGGALGVGLGFGLQRIASNYVSGFIILLDKSIKLGDMITVDLHYGVVRDLRTRYLVLQKLDGTEVIIPNETMIINPVINHSFLDRNTRVFVTVQVTYQSDLDLVIKLLLKVAEDHSRVLMTPEPTAIVTGLADSGIDLRLSVWIPDAELGTSMLQSELYLAIWRLFKVNNILIPYPQKEVRILGDR